MKTDLNGKSKFQFRFFRSGKKKPARSTDRFDPVRFRPALETLEDRLVMNAGGTSLPDAVLAWNQIMLDANAVDFTDGSPEQGGPTGTTRAFAIVSAAMYDALNSITHQNEEYLTEVFGYESADPHAAVSAAAYHTLAALFPAQHDTFKNAYDAWKFLIPGDSAAETQGLALGTLVANNILTARQDDHSHDPMIYAPTNPPLPGHHQEDPLNPGQGFLHPQWSEVTPFVVPNLELAPPPPDLDSEEYARAYNEVLLYGGDGVTTPTLRTQEQTDIGIYWAYDGTPGMGTPPRMYNQITHVIAEQQGNTMEENARLFALVNLALGDAGIQSWATKYEYDFWRPVVAIRAGDTDGNPLTVGVEDWTPLGAPYTNGPEGGKNFTPPFPAYTSGHATFGAAAFQTIANFYGTDHISFDFTSDELNGINKDVSGEVRPSKPRHFYTLSQAIEENAISRLYLGIHWRFDAEDGIRSGRQIADYVTENALTPRGASVDLTFAAGNNQTDVLVSVNEEVAQIIDRKTGDVLRSRPVEVVRSITVTGALTKSNNFVVDGAAGEILPGGIQIQGGSRKDKLILVGTSAADLFVVTTSAVTLNGQTVHFSGLEALCLDAMDKTDTVTINSTPEANLLAAAFSEPLFNHSNHEDDWYYSFDYQIGDVTSLFRHHPLAESQAILVAIEELLKN